MGQLVDTDVLNEDRNGARANAGVCAFFAVAVRGDTPLYLTAVTIGELRRGVDMIRHRGTDPRLDRSHAQHQALRACWRSHPQPVYLEQRARAGTGILTTPVVLASGFLK